MNILIDIEKDLENGCNGKKEEVYYLLMIIKYCIKKIF